MFETTGFSYDVLAATFDGYAVNNEENLAYMADHAAEGRRLEAEARANAAAGQGFISQLTS